jgi:hypothetical protein
MSRIGAFALALVLLACCIGCDEKSASVVQTGLNLSFANCVTTGIYVFIDGDDDLANATYCSSEITNFIEIAPGTHTLNARANITVADTSYCWTRSFSVSDGQITELVLDCIGASCDTTATPE